MHKKAPIVAEGGNLKTKCVSDSISCAEQVTQAIQVATQPPQSKKVNIQNIPDELKALDIWVCWQYELNANGDKWTKVPYQANLKSRAQSNNYKTWCSFADVLKAYESGACAGIGIFNSYKSHTIEIDNLVQGDIDHCFNNNGTLTVFAQDVLNILGAAYIEISPSGTGIRFLCRADVELKSNKNTKLGLELYQHGRYVTVTGDVLDNSVSAILDKTAEVQAIYDKYLHKEEKQAPKQSANVQALDLSDFDLLQKIFDSKNGSEIKSLYDGYFPEGQHSEADLSLCNHLAFWTQKDSNRIDALFRQSGLMRPKWDELRGHDTYGNITIDKAIANCSQVYDPKHKQDLDIAPTTELKDLADEYYEINTEDTEGYLTPEIYQEYLKPNTILIVQSIYGSGKTTALAKFLEGVKNVLGVTHLVALVSSLSDKFKTAYYQKLSEREYINYGDSDGYLAKFNNSLNTTINSLAKTNLCGEEFIPNTFFIDEVSQVIKRLFDDEITNELQIYKPLKRFIAKSLNVVLMDADIDETVFELCRAAAPDKKIIFVKNTYQPSANYTFEKLKNDKHSVRKTIELLKNGHKVAFGSNASIKRLNGFKKVIEKELPDLKILVVHSKNKDEAEQKAFIDNPNTECLKYDLIIYSPTLGSGFDVPRGHGFTFVGYFALSKETSDPKSIVQQMHRFRDVEKLYVAVDKYTGSEGAPLDIESVLNNFNNNLEYENKYVELDSDLNIVRYDDFERIHAATIADTNKQLVNGHKTVFDLLKATGRKFVDVAYVDITKEETQVLKDACNEVLEEYAEIISKADNISSDEATELAKQKYVTPVQSHSIERRKIIDYWGLDKLSDSQIELHFGKVLTLNQCVETMVINDDNSKIKRKLKKLLLVLATDEGIKKAKANDVSLTSQYSTNGVSVAKATTKTKHYALRREYYRTILKLANVNSKTLISQDSYTARELSEVIKANYDSLKPFKSIANISSEKVLLENPIRWLNAELNSFGFKTTSQGRERRYTAYCELGSELVLKAHTLEGLSYIETTFSECELLATSRTVKLEKKEQKTKQTKKTQNCEPFASQI